MQIGDLVKHRVNDMIGIIVRFQHIGTIVVVRWNNGGEFSERTINLVSLCN